MCVGTYTFSPAQPALGQQFGGPLRPPVVPPSGVTPGGNLPIGQIGSGQVAPDASRIFSQGAATGPGAGMSLGQGGDVFSNRSPQMQAFRRTEGFPPGGARGDYGSVFIDPSQPSAHQLKPSQDVLDQYKKFVPEVVDPEVPLKLLVGQPRILRFNRDLTGPKLKLYIPDETIARWDILSETDVAVVGLKPGESVLTAWVSDDQSPGEVKVLSYLLQVYDANGASSPTSRGPPPPVDKVNLQEELCRAFPNADLQLSLVAGELVIRGQVKDAIEANEIVQLLERIIRSRGGGDDQQIIVATGQATILSEVRNASFTNMLRIPGEQQVNLRVTIAEINRSALRSIGADVQVGSGDVSFLSLVGGTNFTATTGQGNLVVNRPDFRLVLNALRRMNLARSLAEPNLTALNGQPANFFSGDQVPLPNAVAGFGGVGQSVIFTRVGIQLTFTPFVIDRDRIRLQLQGNVSSIDPDAQQTNIGGSAVSTQNARSFQTTLDLRDGETMALAGLISNTYAASDARVPFVGDLPYIGNLFGNKQATQSEQELVVLVTPELVHPLPKCQTPGIPGSDVFEPTDHEFYMKGRLESRRSHDYRSSVRTDMPRQCAGERCQGDLHIIGPSGYTCCGDGHQPFAESISSEVTR